ncbi:MAG: RNA pseudouridine synthase [Cyanobacteria bacterium TMED177]|nr:MAG: RNA pseudouridine synthase [Cyanobacteria bacterium TMED177]
MSSGWRPAALNDGWTYRDRVPVRAADVWLSRWLAERYQHSAGELWRQRIESGELDCNGQRLVADRRLTGGESIIWRRPPWLEEAIPDQWQTIHDDGDLMVINKPSGLPVMPGGGFLRHTLTALLESTGARPVHRLGRFTSGLQVCARTPQTRALWSKRFRPDGGCRKVYQAWAQRVPGLELGQALTVTSDVVERPHPLLGWIWGPEPMEEEPIRKRLSAHSELRLLERTADGDRLQVTITTGRPHQIRIHLAQLGSPLLGDPLYLSNREVSASATPGDGGYRLHAWLLSGLPRLGDVVFQVPPPVEGVQTLRNSIKREK